MKNFSLKGLSNAVQFGRNGLMLVNNDTQFSFRNADDTDFVEVFANYPTLDDSVATKKYVDDNSGGGGGGGLVAPTLGTPVTQTSGIVSSTVIFSYTGTQGIWVSLASSNQFNSGALFGRNTALTEGLVDVGMQVRLEINNAASSVTLGNFFETKYVPVTLNQTYLASRRTPEAIGRYFIAHSFLTPYLNTPSLYEFKLASSYQGNYCSIINASICIEQI